LAEETRNGVLVSDQMNYIVFILLLICVPAIYINNAQIWEEADGSKRIDTEKYPGQLGLTLELCAGIMDKEHTPQQTAQMELMEECGYKVPLDSLHRVTSFRYRFVFEVMLSV
jgi:UDP-sugar diphosphatase